MFSKYFEMGYSPIPVIFKGKNPSINEWQKYCEKKPSEELIEKWDALKQTNIGIACGKASGIIVLDIDTDDKDFLNKLPPSPVRRRGQKGEARFFRYSTTIKSSRVPYLDVLSDGRQIVVPNSIHPSGVNYIWLTPDTLLNTKPEELPELPHDFLSLIETRSKTEGVKTTGRNNQLVKLVSAMRGSGESESEIVKRAYEWDCLYNNPRLFSDKSEGYNAQNEDEAKKNAWLFVNSVTKSLINVGVARINSDMVIEINDEQDLLKVKSKEQTYPEPVGLLKEIKDLILDYSERDMPNLALGGAVSLMSAISCNRYRFNQCWPNTYVLNLAPTGAGKSFPQKIISMILDEKLGSNLVGFGNYQSSAAFAKNLVSRRERLDVIDEVSSLFAQMKGGGLWQMGILEEMCKVWSNSNGKYNAAEYSEKEDTSSCFNPCVNVLGSSTIEGIKNNFNKMMVTKGLIPRFLIFSHENYGAIKQDFLNEELLDIVCFKISKILSTPKKESDTKVDVRCAPAYNPINLAPIDNEAKEFFNHLKVDFANKIELEQSENMRSLLTRGKEQVMKLAIIHAVGRDSLIELSDLVWAKSVFEVCLNNSQNFIEESATDNEWEKDVQTFLHLFDKKKFVTKKFAYNRMRSLKPNVLDQIIKRLIDSDKIECAEKTQNGRKFTGWVTKTQ